MRGKSPGMKWRPPPFGSVHSTRLCKQKARGQRPHAAPCPQNKVGFANRTSHPGESFAETNENTEKRDQPVKVFFFTFVQNTRVLSGSPSNNFAQSDVTSTT